MRRQERGFAVLLVFVMASVIAITLYTEIPRVAFESQRVKEQLLVDRGNQYKRAIQVFFRKNKRFPANMDELEKFQEVRYLRRKYKDPFTGKDEWRIIHVGPGGFLIDSLVQKPPQQALDKDGKPLTTTDGLNGQQNPGFQSTNGGATGANGQPEPPNGGAVGGLNLAVTRRASDRTVLTAGPAGPVAPPDGDPNQPVVQQPIQQPYPGQQYPPVQYPQPVQYPGQPGQPVQYPQPGQYPQPVQYPGQPGQYPGQPGQYPQPVQYPGQPAQYPGQPGQYPGQPGQYPQPVQYPGQPVQYPGQPIQYPGQPGQPIQPGVVLPYAPVPGQPYQIQPYNPNQPFNPNQPTAIQPIQPTPPSPGGPPAPGAGVLPGQGPGGALGLINGAIFGARPGGLGGGGLGGNGGSGGIAGVATTFKGLGIKVINERHKYQEWEFVYDLKKDKSIVGNQQTPNTQTPQTGQPGNNGPPRTGNQ